LLGAESERLRKSAISIRRNLRTLAEMLALAAKQCSDPAEAECFTAALAAARRSENLADRLVTLLSD
jgi:hypothetical protein